MTRTSIRTITALLAGTAISLSLATNAQTPPPREESMTFLDRLFGPQVSSLPGTFQEISQIPGTDRTPRDRFGNVIRGNTCADHWSNCAFDPTNPNKPVQQGRLSDH